MMVKKGLTVRMDNDLLHKIHIIADYEGRSASGQVLMLIRKFVDEYEAKHGEIIIHKKEQG